MNHRAVFRCVIFFTVFFLLAAVLAAFVIHASDPANPQKAKGPRNATHPFDETFSDCRACHGIRGENSMPLTHSRFSIQTCKTCHKPA